MTYPFPDPAVTPEFEADNGITYTWGGDKWVVKTFTSPTNYITPAVANTDYVRVDGTSTMVGDLVFNGDRSVKSPNGNIKLNASGTVELSQAGTTAITVDNIQTSFVNKSIYFRQDAAFEGEYQLFMGAGYNVKIKNGTFAQATLIATLGYVKDYALAKSGNITISGTTTFTNQTAISFNSSSSQSIETKGALLFYGLTADNSRPSWEACSVSIDPNNENFSAFNTGKRFYWTGTYAYLNGSLRNYVGDATWDFRDNDTDNNIVLSIDSAKAEYNGAITTNKSIATKEYVDAIKTAAAAASDFADFQTRIAAL